ncbi:MAG TPA: hypothetical protein VGN88_01840, partial [Phycisphaerae bacterium]
MKFTHKSVIAAALMAGLFLAGGLASRGLGAAPAPAATTYPAPTKLAVVNLVELFDGLSEKTAADTAIEQMKKGFDDE